MSCPLVQMPILCALFNLDYDVALLNQQGTHNDCVLAIIAGLGPIIVNFQIICQLLF